MIEYKNDLRIKNEELFTIHLKSIIKYFKIFTSIESVSANYQIMSYTLYLSRIIGLKEFMGRGGLIVENSVNPSSSVNINIFLIRLRHS